MVKTVYVEPQDEYNQQLVANVHPPDWQNPTPAEKYNLVVIGAGTAGLVVAAGAAGLGARVALVERHLIGGDCLNVGCVPSKALIRSAEAVGHFKAAANLGIHLLQPETVDFAAVMRRLRQVRSRISHHDSAARFRDLGVDVFLGDGSFTGPDTVEVDGVTLRFSKAVIATGARAVQPPIEGIQQAGFLTNETVFTLTERPARLAVFGAGPLGCELAQAFARLGSQVTIIEQKGQLLSREDPDAAALVMASFKKDGIDIRTDTTVQRVSHDEQGKHLHLKVDGKEDIFTVDEILMGAGRTPNVEGLNLEGVGVQYDTRQGVYVNDYLQTTNPRIYAAGDICLKYKFTHTADAAARIVLKNALFGFMGKMKLSDLVIPWCTYTVPAIAHVGLYEDQAREQGIDVDTFLLKLDDVDRAVTDGEEDGLIKVHVRKGTDKIVGATIVAANAGDMISEITLAMTAKIGLGKIAQTIHPYPTQSEAIKKVADAWNRSRLTPGIHKIFRKIMAWQR